MLHDLTGRGDSGLPVVAVVHPGVLAATVYQRLADELAVTGDPLHSLHGTADLAEALVEQGVTVRSEVRA